MFSRNIFFRSCHLSDCLMENLPQHNFVALLPHARIKLYAIAFFNHIHFPDMLCLLIEKISHFLQKRRTLVDMCHRLPIDLL